MKTKLQKWGNSLGVRIPHVVVREAGISEGADVAITLEKGRIVLAPLGAVTLKALVDRITPDNRHEEFDFGRAQGKEAW
jgi:antitoxin MazE